jgi:hypothetical protein
MNIIKPVGVFIQNKKCLVARDADEDFFKNVGGRVLEDETELESLKRTLATDLGFALTIEPERIFDFPPTPAQGDPGDFVVLRGYLISVDENLTLTPQGKLGELAWVHTDTQSDFKLTPQIKELILPKLKELGLIE